MTQGLVSPLLMTAPRPLTSAFHAAAWGCVLFAFLLIESLQLANPHLQLWPAVILLMPLPALLWTLHRSDTTESAFAYMLGGGVLIGLYSSVLMVGVKIFEESDTAPHMLVKVALLLGGGPGVGLIGAISWPLAGFLIGEVAVRVAAFHSGGSIEIDATTFFALLVVVTARIIAFALGRPNSRVRAILRRAAREEERAMARARVELNASALLHDTVLRDLSQLTASGPGALDDRLKRRLRLDLDLLANATWATAAPVGSEMNHSAGSPNLDAVVTAVREHGLAVEVTGDIIALSAVTEEQRLAISMAVYQCLVNVSEHSGVERAEVTVARTASALSVMIVDGGRGFRLNETSPDRLGLRQSVVRRMVDVGGTGRIWSTPGRGTAVQLLVPIGGRSGRR